MSKMGDELLMEEARIICDELVNQPKALILENVTQPLIMALKHMTEWEKIQKVFTTLCNITDYKDKEKVSNLFLSHARLLEFQKQQQVATKLYQNFKEKKFLFWTVASLLLQAPKNVPDSLQLKLATAHLEKALDKDIKNPEVIRLYISLLDRSGSFEKIIIILKGNFGDLLEPLPFDRKQMIADYSKKSKDLNMRQLSNGMYSHLLEKYNSDEFGWWQGYIDTVMLLQDTKSESKTITLTLEGKQDIQLKFTDSIEDAKKFIKNLQEIESKKSVIQRGPFLAEIDLETKLFSQKKSEEKDIIGLILNYFKLFGSKPVFFGDVKKYLEIWKISKENCQDLVSKMTDLLPKDMESEKYLLFDINLEKIVKSFGIYKGKEEEIYPKLLKKFFSSLSQRKEISDQKVGTKLGDDYLLIYSHYLIDLYDQKKDSFYLEKAIVALEYGLTKNRDNFQMKILLCRLYITLGCIENALEIFYSLDTKHIQWETLSYLILSDVLNSPGFTEKSISFLEKINGFIKEHSRETPDLLLYAYEKESYSKIEEFIEFKYKMDYSFQVSNVICNKILLGISKNNSLVQDTIQYLQREVKNIKFNEIFINNDDLECPTFYDIKSEETPLLKLLYSREIQLPFQDRINHLKVKRLIPQLLLNSILIYHFNERKKPEKKKKEEIIEWKPTDQLIKEEEKIFIEFFEKFKLSLENSKERDNYNILIHSFQISLYIYQYLYQIKSSQPLKNEEDLICKELEILMDTIHKQFQNNYPKKYSVDVFGPISHLKTQLVIVTSLLPAWVNIFSKKEKVKSMLKKLKDLILQDLNELKKNNEIIRKSDYYSKGKKEEMNQEYSSFYDSIEKKITNDIFSSMTRVNRVISDFTLELETIRL